jgi:hypothetical protein
MRRASSRCWRAINGPARPWLYGDRLRMGGVKLYADGALGSRGAWLKQPYADKRRHRGLPFLTTPSCARRPDAPRALAASRSRCTRSATPPTRRCSGDRGAGALPTRATGAGGSSMRRSSIPPTSRASRATASSPRCSRCTRPATGRWPKRGWARGWAAPMPGRRMLAKRRAAGVRLRLPGRGSQPLPGLAAAISRQDPDGPAAGRLAAAGAGEPRPGAGRLHPRRGLCRLRRGPIGSLEPGKWADFILVDRDPVGVPRTTSRTRCWKPGSQVWRPGSPAKAGTSGERG